MKRAELYSRLLVAATAIAAVGVPLIAWNRAPLIHARLAENGGWSPETLRAQVGQPLHLRLTSDDVVHGFAVGQMPMQSVDVLPGKVTDVTLTFDKPGTYTFYCTRWCGINHWRMRGTVEVSGGDQASASPASPPLYVRLGIDLDAPRSIPEVPAVKPVAEIASRQLSNDLAQYESAAYSRSHSPYEAWQELRRNPAFLGKSDADLWNLTASIWNSGTTPEALAEGERLFGQNCAACHGEQGRGDGVFADDLAASGEASMQAMAGSVTSIRRPANFSDPARLLTASPALLQGKILRGGMGTGMPSWGPIFTEEETWDLVAHLYSLQFGYH
jgi:mono/diheme cytochrome c family protein/plastocyanin